MGSPRMFSAVNTKIRAKQSRLLEVEDYINLINGKDLNQQLNYLKSRTHYEDVLKGAEADLSITEIEYRLSILFMQEMKSLNYYFDGPLKHLVKVEALRFETENIKLFLRAIERGEDTESLISKMHNVNITNVDMEALARSTSIPQFVKNLSGTIYHDVLEKYVNEDYEKILFYMEMSLDRMYFDMLLSAGKALDKENSKLFLEIMGRNVDLLNLEWIYRGLNFYSLLPEELYNYSLSGGYYFDDRKIRSMCYMSLKDLKATVLKTEYSFLFDTKRDVDLYMERRVDRYLYFMFKNMAKKGEFNIGVATAYYHLLEYEIKDICSILEAKRYKLSIDAVEEYLIRRLRTEYAH